MKILVDREEDYFLVRPDPEPPGMYKVGRGQTMEQALGEFLRNYQEELEVQIGVSPEAWPFELERRQKELAKR